MATGTKSKYEKIQRKEVYHATFGEDIDILNQDRRVKTDPSDSKRRRTIAVFRVNGSCGFTLQSYGILNKQTNETEVITYVDYVELYGPAYRAGLRAGDVIMAINGVTVENVDHTTIVNYIRSSGPVLRMVVLFEDCCRKVELRFRRIKLQHLLAEKIQQLKELEEKEAEILKGFSRNNSFYSHSSGSESSLVSSPSVSSFCVSPSPFPESDTYATVHSIDGSSLSREFKRGRGVENASFHSADNVRCRSHRLTVGDVEGLAAVASTSRTDDNVFLSPNDAYHCSSLPRHFGRNKPHKISSRKLNIFRTSTPLQKGPNGLPMKEDESSKFQRTSSADFDKEKSRDVRTSPTDSPGLRSSFQRRFNCDHRPSSSRSHRRMSNYVATEDVNTVDGPQLLSLRHFCNDFRTSCLQHNLEQRQKTLNKLMSVDNSLSSLPLECSGLDQTEHSDACSNVSQGSVDSSTRHSPDPASYNPSPCVDKCTDQNGNIEVDNISSSNITSPSGSGPDTVKLNDHSSWGTKRRSFTSLLSQDLMCINEEDEDTWL